MKADLRKRVGGLLSQSWNKSLKDRLYVFGICLGISIFFWLLIKLSKDYSTTVKYPVQFSGLPVDYYTLKEPEPYLNFEITAKGSDILDLKYFSTKNKIDVELERAVLTRIEDRYIAKIPTVNYLKSIASKSKYYDILNRIYPDTLYFEFAKLSHKKVPVFANVDFSLQRQYFYYDSVSLSRDSIILTGISNELDSIDFVSTRLVERHNIDNNINEMVSIEVPQHLKSVRADVENLTLKAFVEEYTEDSKNVKVHIFNVPEEYELKIFPENIRINYNVALKDYAVIDEDSFMVYVDFPNDSILENTRRLKVNLNKIPPHIVVRSMEPAEVEFILIEKYD